jgi:uncharacterized membrane protein YqiK
MEVSTLHIMVVVIVVPLVDYHTNYIIFRNVEILEKKAEFFSKESHFFGGEGKLNKEILSNIRRYSIFRYGIFKIK